MGAPDAELQEWVNNSCHPLPGTDMKSPHHINENQARLDAASVFLKTLIGWLLDADGREGFSFPNIGYVLKELRPYYTETLYAWLPFLAVAGLLLLCWLPLWISRCCAHRCCAPTRSSYGRKRKAVACGCCSLWGVATLTCISLGIAYGTQMSGGVQGQMCTLYDSLGTNAYHSGLINTSASVLVVTGIVYNDDNVQPALASLRSLLGIFGPEGCITLACAQLERASEIAIALPGKVEAAGQVFVGGDIPEWRTLVKTLRLASELACATVQVVKDTGLVDQAVDKMNNLASLLDTVFGGNGYADNLASLGEKVGSMSTDLYDFQGGLAEQMRRSWPLLGSTNLGLAVNAVPVLLFVLAALGVCCMGLSTRVGAVAGTTTSCTKASGVCLSGFAWVGTSICAFLQLLIGGLLLLSLVGLFDFSSVFKDVRDPNTLIGQARCAAPVLPKWRAPDSMAGLTWVFDWDKNGVADGELNFCNIIADCLKVPSVSALGVVEKALGFTLDVDVWNATIYEAIDAIDAVADIASAELQQLIDSVQNTSRDVTDLATSPAQLCEGGCTTNNSAVISDDLATIFLSLNTTLPCVREALVHMRVILGATARMAHDTPALLNAVTGMTDNFQCGWFRPAYFEIFEPSVDGLMGGISGLAVSMGFCGAVGLLLIGWLIVLQVYCGGVGRVCGGPSCCRVSRCCQPTKTATPARLTAEVEVVEGSKIVV